MKKNKIEGAEQSGLLPKHIAVIMDGNGRWAKKRLMPRSFGHQQGMNRMIGLLEHAFDVGIDYVTVYALSTENLKRPKEELDGLFNLLRKHFVDCMRRICARGVRLKILGDVSLLPQDVQGLLKKAEEDSVMYLGRGVNVALGYGSRAEIVARGEARGGARGNADGGKFFRLSLHRGTARSRSRHPHGQRAAALQFSPLSVRVCGTVFFRQNVPRIFG